MHERFGQFIWNFPLVIEHENHGDPERIHRYGVGLQRLRLLRRLAEPFAFGPFERAKEQGEMIYAFLIFITDDTRSSLLPEKVKYEYLVGSVTERKVFKIFGYLWFESLENARDYVTKKGMTIVGVWHEHN